MGTDGDRLLVFGAMPDSADPAGDPAGDAAGEPDPAEADGIVARLRTPLRRAARPGSPRAARRAADRRARARRRAAIQRSRPRMRAGSPGLLAVLVLVSLTLLLADVRSPAGAFDGVRAVTTTLLGPLQSLAGWLAGPILPDEGAADPAEVQRLRAEVADLRAQVDAGAGTRARLAELESLLRLQSATGYEVVAADVVAYPAGASWTVTVDAGSADGIDTDMAVLADGGLVGRVVDVGLGHSTVRLLASPDLTVAARVVGPGEAGALTGTGAADAVQAALLDPAAQVPTGAAVVTFGSPAGRPYPPGLPIGTVSAVDRAEVGRLTATVRPYADLTALSVVAIVVGPGPDGGGR